MWVTLSISRCKWIAKFTVFSRCARGVSEEKSSQIWNKKREGMDASVYIFTLCLKLYMLFIRRDVKPTFNAASLIPDCCYSQCILRTSVCVCFLRILCVCVWYDVCFWRSSRIFLCGGAEKLKVTLDWTPWIHLMLQKNMSLQVLPLQTKLTIRCLLTAPLSYNTFLKN